MTLALSPTQPPEARYPEHMMVAEAQPTGDVHFRRSPRATAFCGSRWKAAL